MKLAEKTDETIWYQQNPERSEGRDEKKPDGSYRMNPCECGRLKIWFLHMCSDCVQAHFG